MDDIKKVKNILNFMTVKIIHRDNYNTINEKTKKRLGKLCFSFQNEMGNGYWNSDYMVIVMIGSLLLGVAVLSKKTEHDEKINEDYDYMYLQYLCGKPGFGAGSLALVESEKLSSSLGMRYVQLSSLGSKEEYYRKRGYLPFKDSCSDELELQNSSGSMTKCLSENEKIKTTKKFSSSLSDHYDSDEYDVVTKVLEDIKTEFYEISDVPQIETVLKRKGIFSQEELKSIISISDYYIDVVLTDNPTMSNILGCALLKIIDENGDRNGLHDDTVSEIERLSDKNDEITEEHGLFLVLMCGNTPQAIGSIILELIYKEFPEVNFIHTECNLKDISSYIKLGFKFPQSDKDGLFKGVFNERNDELVHMMKEIKRSNKRKDR